MWQGKYLYLNLHTLRLSNIEPTKHTFPDYKTIQHQYPNQLFSYPIHKECIKQSPNIIQLSDKHSNNIKMNKTYIDQWQTIFQHLTNVTYIKNWPTIIQLISVSLHNIKPTKHTLAVMMYKQSQPRFYISLIHVGQGTVLYKPIKGKMIERKYWHPELAVFDDPQLPFILYRSKFADIRALEIAINKSRGHSFNQVGV